MKILEYFPPSLKELINNNIGQDYMKLEEIRLRANNPIILKFNYGEKVLSEKISQNNIKEILQLICENSIYAYQNEINHGYITISGGHRIGISGNCVIENNKVINISYIYSLNFRISKEIKGAADKIIKYVINSKEKTIFSSLIVSPPGAGKTTVLRDIIRQLSNGLISEEINGKNIGVVDERGEIASMYRGIPQNDLGIRTDVLENIPKALGMEMLIRSMAPEIIVADEIGSYEDIYAINYANSCGIKGIFTAHGGQIEDLYLNPNLSKILMSNSIELIIFLEKNIKGNVSEIYYLDKFEKDSSKKYKQCINI